MEAAIREFVCRRFHSALGSRRLDPDSPLFSSGIVDSFGLLELIAFLEDSFGVSIDPARHDLIALDTPRRIGALVTTLIQPRS